MPNFATAEEVAARLELRAQAIYQGEAGTSCLRKLTFGAKVRWYWPQVEAHLRNVLVNGACDKSCNAVFDKVDEALAAEKGLRLVPPAQQAG